MNITVLSHNLSSNAAMRAHRLASALSGRHEVTLIGPARKRGTWDALPDEPWIHSVRKRRFPEFSASFAELVDAARGDVLLAVKPHLASFGVALVAAELHGVPLILDLDDLDTALAPRSEWVGDPILTDLSRPGSAVYVSLLTRAAPTASAITVASTALQRRFGGTLVPHGADERLFNPERVDRDEARLRFGFEGPTVVFAGTPREHKGVEPLAQAVARLSNVRLAVLARPEDVAGAEWRDLPVDPIPQLPYTSLPVLIAAADVVAIPQLDTEAGRHQMPMKAFDAMAMGRPILASAVSDLPSVLDGCARLVQPGAVDDLAQALAELLEQRDEVGELGRRARERFLDRYTLRHVGEILDEVIAPLVR